MSAHTKGPWIAAAAGSSIVGWPVVASGGRSICSVTWTPKTAIGKGFTAADWEAFNAECKANAQLIGAAPDLKDGCNALLGLIQLVLGRDDLSSELRTVLQTNHRVQEARDAIAKTEPS